MFDIFEFRYRVRDAVAAAGCTEKDIENWRRRGFLRTIFMKSSRGRVRLYSLANIYELAVLKSASRVGFNLKQLTDHSDWPPLDCYGFILDEDGELREGPPDELARSITAACYVDAKWRKYLVNDVLGLWTPWARDRAGPRDEIW